MLILIEFQGRDLENHPAPPKPALEGTKQTGPLIAGLRAENMLLASLFQPDVIARTPVWQLFPRCSRD